MALKRWRRARLSTGMVRLHDRVGGYRFRAKIMSNCRAGSGRRHRESSMVTSNGSFCGRTRSFIIVNVRPDAALRPHIHTRPLAGLLLTVENRGRRPQSIDTNVSAPSTDYSNLCVARHTAVRIRSMAPHGISLRWRTLGNLLNERDIDAHTTEIYLSNILRRPLGKADLKGSANGCGNKTIWYRRLGKRKN
ncbi:MAG: hypothetical protein QOD93_4250 [Acetobacteraceae bacterium]|nr:hypothetical protein [Acetobacteraceae bacterium]